MRKIACVAFVIVVFGFAGMSVAAGGPFDTTGFSKAMSIDKPSASPHADGWVPLPRAGGETCATATAIPALPYLDSGSTVGAVNDYDEVCPYSGGTAPDVVYSFTPATTMTVDISLCSGLPETDYDSKLYVYENACPDGGPFACDDDGCATSFTSYASHVLGLTLTGGNTYYIVVDGYGTSTGNYTIEMTEALPWVSENPCDPTDLLVGQDPTNELDDWSFGTSTAAAWAAPGYAIYDDVQSGYYDVCGVHFSGLSLFNNGAWNACDPTADGGMPFTIGFYPDDGGGQPNVAAPICEYAGVVPDAITNTGLVFSGFSMFTFDVDAFASCCQLPASGTVWVMIQNEPMTTVDCAFMWASSGNGLNNSSMQYDYDLATWTDTGYDRAMCLTGTTWPVELQNFSIE